MDLWVDDRRPPEAYGFRGFTWAKTSEAIALLGAGGVRFASLDHDLGLESGTGYDIVCWMEKHNVWPPDGVGVHSMNPVGRKRMEAVIERQYGRMVP